MAEHDRLPAKARARIFALADMQEGTQVALNSNLRQISELGKAYDIASDAQRKIELKKEADRRQELQGTQSDRCRGLTDLNARIRRMRAGGEEPDGG